MATLRRCLHCIWYTSHSSKIGNGHCIENLVKGGTIHYVASTYACAFFKRPIKEGLVRIEL